MHPDFPYILHRNPPRSFESYNNLISCCYQQYSGGINEISHRKRQWNIVDNSKRHFFLLFWQTAIVALLSQTLFSTVLNIIPASQVLLRRNCLIRLRISQNSDFGTTTPVIWKTTYCECLITLAPILITFLRNVLNCDWMKRCWSSSMMICWMEISV